MGSTSRIQVGVLQPNTVFGLHLMDQVHKLLLIFDVFRRDQIMGIQRNVMAGSRKQATQLLRMKVVQQIVEDHEARFAAITNKFLRYALVIFYVFAGQILT